MKNRNFFISIILVFICALTINAQPPVNSVEWIKFDPNPDYTSNWRTVSMNADGSKILATVYHKSVYLMTSTTGVMVDVTPEGARSYWKCADVSADGSTFVIGSSTGRLFRSTDDCATWTEMRPSGEDKNKAWESFSMSDDGKVMLAAAGGLLSGHLYLSNDAGETWNEQKPSGDDYAAWSEVAVSGDGKTLVAGISDDEAFISTDGATAWKELKPNGEYIDITSACINSDGKKILVTGGGKALLSEDNGATWLTLNVDNSRSLNFSASAMSDNGNVIMLVCYSDDDGRAYLSTHGGSVWSECQPNGDSEELWNDVAVSADGIRALLVAHQGYLFANANDLDDGGTTSVHAIESASIEIYPNPTKGDLFINTLNNKMISSVEVYSVNGAKVLSFDSLIENKLQFKSLQQGKYFVKIIFDDNTDETRVIIKQ